MEIFLKGGTAVTIDANWTVIEEAALHIKDGKIEAIGKANEISIPEGAKVLDTSQCLILPGLVNCHTHLGLGLIRGLAEDLPLEKWLNEVIFPTERKWGSPEFVDIGSKLSLLEMIRSGTTTLNDMYFFEEVIAKAVHEAGLRGICGQTVLEVEQMQDTTGFAECARRLEKSPCPTRSVGSSRAPSSGIQLMAIREPSIERTIRWLPVLIVSML